MMTRVTFLLLLVSVPLLLPGRASAWGSLGHQVVADLAQDMLTPAARAQAAALLGPPSGGGSGGAAFSLASVSVWADDIKSLRPETRPWHYVTLQLAEPGFKARRAFGNPADSPNVVTAYEAQMAVLRNAQADRYAREEALKWVVHLVGDLHQPLHVGEDRDKGGNLAKVKVGRRTRNLHEVWDYVLLERLNLPGDTLRARLGRALAADTASLARIARGGVVDWVDEAHAKTRDCYLLHGKPLKKGIAQSLDRTYLRPATLVALEQLKVAGVRLAQSLNQALDPAAPPRPPAPSLGAAAMAAQAAPDWFAAAEPDPGETPSRGASRATGTAEAPGAGSGRYGWSANSKVYHYAECAALLRIKRKNLRRGDTVPPGMTLHAGCPRRD